MHNASLTEASKDLFVCVLLREEVLCGASSLHTASGRSYKIAYCVMSCYRDETAQS